MALTFRLRANFSESRVAIELSSHAKQKLPGPAGPAGRRTRIHRRLEGRLNLHRLSLAEASVQVNLGTNRLPLFSDASLLLILLAGPVSNACRRPRPTKTKSGAAVKGTESLKTKPVGASHSGHASRRDDLSPTRRREACAIGQRDSSAQQADF